MAGEKSLRAAGGCLCGGVRYEIRGELRDVVACHCSQCARASGNFVAATSCARADVTLVDARTGEVLSSYPSQTATALAGQGIAGSILDAAVMSDPIDRVVERYAAQYGDWLLPR